MQERNLQIKLVNLQEGLNLITEGTCQCEKHHHCEGNADLHTWTSPKLFLQQANVIFQTLSTQFPQNQSLYEKNFNRLTAELKNLNTEIKKSLPLYKGNGILVSHPALGYFCRDFGLVQLSVECEGKDPRPKDIENILKQARLLKMRCAFLQEGYNNRGAILVAEKLKLPAYKIDPYSKNYLTQMRQIAHYIAE